VDESKQNMWHKWGLLHVRRGNIKGGCQQREHAFLFQVLLKPTLTHGEGRPWRFPPNNEQVGRGMGVSQPGEGGLGLSQEIYMNPKHFLLLACLTPMFLIG
jgi:hypothetical protein